VRRCSLLVQRVAETGASTTTRDGRIERLLCREGRSVAAGADELNPWRTPA
jgi:hypothetical protein